MEDLEKISQTLIEQGLVKFGYTCAWPAAYLVEVPAAQQDNPLVIPDNGKLGYGQYQLSQPWLKKHFFEIREQIKRGIFYYAGRDNNLSRKAFTERTVAFYMQGFSDHALIQAKVKESFTPFEIGCGPLPILVKGQTEKHAFPLGGAAIWVLDNQATREMIKDVSAFLSYLSSDEIQERWHKATGYIPVSLSLLEKLKEFYKTHPFHKAVVEQTLQAPLGQYSFGIKAPNYAEARVAIFDLLDKTTNLDIEDDEVEHFLQEFDNKFSLQPHE